MTFTKETTRAQYEQWINSLGASKHAALFIINTLTTGENKVAGKVTVCNEIAKLAERGIYDTIWSEAQKLGYNG